MSALAESGRLNAWEMGNLKGGNRPKVDVRINPKCAFSPDKTNRSEVVII
jgi:hypothetical protein